MNTFRCVRRATWFVALCLLFACKPLVLSSGEQQAYTRYAIDSTITHKAVIEKQIEKKIAPYKQKLDKEMDRVLTYTPVPLEKGFNAALPNLSADLFLAETNKIFQEKYQKTIDAVLLNDGGLRRTFDVGALTVGNVYELMPFDNKAVVLELTPARFLEMIAYLRKDGRPHPIAGITFNTSGETLNLQVGGKKFDKQKNYTVATSDFLQGGGDGMTFFANPEKKTDLNVMVRDLVIRYFDSADTLKIDFTPRYITP